MRKGEKKRKECRGEGKKDVGETKGKEMKEKEEDGGLEKGDGGERKVGEMQKR